MRPYYRASSVRAAIVVALGAALVILTPRFDGVVDVNALSSSRLSSPSLPGQSESRTQSMRAPVDRSTLLCPGPDQVGLADPAIPEKPQSVVIETISAPPEALPSTMTGTEPTSGLLSRPGQLLLRGGGAGTLGQADRRGETVRTDLDQGVGVTVSARGSLSPGASGVQMFLGDQNEQLGLALTPCLSPREEAWLIAGGGHAGHRERLVLVNPGQGPITASVSVLGSSVDLGSEGPTAVIALQPGARDIMLLDALAPGEVSPVVHVSASGGPVSAYLGDRLLQGTIDRGSELTPPVLGPARRQVIAGLSIPPGSPTTAGVRVAVPGPEQAVVEVAARSASGSVPLDADVTLIPGQRVADIDISDLPEDTYALEVTSDEPIIAAAHVRSPADERGRDDVAWAPSSAAVTTLAGTPLPQAGEGPPVGYTLDLVAARDGAVRVVTTTDQGKTKTQSVDLVGGRVISVELPDAASVWLAPKAQEIQAAVRGEVSVISRASDDAVTLDAAEATGNPGEPTGEVDKVNLVSVLPLSELSLFRSVAAVTPARP